MLGPTATLIALVALAMLSAGGLAYALLYGRIQSESQAGERLSKIQSRAQTVSAASVRQTDPAKRRKSIQDSLKELDEKQKAKQRQANSPPLGLRLQQAGLSWTRRTYLFVSTGSGIAIALLSLLFGLPLYAVAGLTLAGVFGLPRWFVGFRRRRRIGQFLEEFPNAVDVIVRGIKAGLPLNDTLRVIAAEAAEPVKGEFRSIVEAQAMGMPIADAVQRLPERMPVPEANFFAIVIAIQSRAGGNLSEALGNLSRVLRDRKKMKAKIKAMSMEAKASAAIIGSLPLIVMMLVYLSSPQYITLLFTERLGHLIIGASLVWMTIGILVMRKMINFDF